MRHSFEESPGSLAWKVKQQRFRAERLAREAATGCAPAAQQSQTTPNQHPQGGDVK